MSDIDIAAAVLRSVHVAALASLFGTLLFMAVALPVGSGTAQMRRSMRRLALISALAGLIAGLAWLTVQSAAIAGADSVAMALHVVPTVALRTQFGHWMLLRLFAADRRALPAASPRRGNSDRRWRAWRLPCNRFSATPGPSAVRPVRN